MVLYVHCKIPCLQLLCLCRVVGLGIVGEVAIFYVIHLDFVIMCLPRC